MDTHAATHVLTEPPPPGARRQSPIDRPERWTNARWRRYFAANRLDLLDIPWQRDVLLPPAVRDRVARSIAIFQLGESGEGKTFRRFARLYAARSGDHDYPEALDAFIAEEHRHARDLGRFLDAQGWPRLTRQWSDSIMHHLRQTVNLEMEIAVLLVAEWIAMLYYPALRHATTSPALQTLCRQILRDERYHILFQAGMLGRLRRDRSAWSCRLRDLSLILLMRGAMVGVWWDHAPVFRLAGVGWRDYWRRGSRMIRAGLAAIHRARHAA